jgi:hypothetical protein
VNALRRSTVLLFLAGCDPGWKIEGTVVDPAGLPVEAASVALSCPGGGTGAGAMPQMLVTGPSGRFAFGGVSGAANAGKCFLVINKPGFAMKTVGAPDACYRSTQTGNFTTPCGPTDGRITIGP